MFLPKDLELVTIVAVDAIPRREPHETLAILEDIPNATFGETIVGRQVLKLEMSV